MTDLEPYDVSITDEDGRLVVHRVDCRDVRRLADAGEMVVTMLDCTGALPADIVRHSCMTGEQL